MNALTAIPLEAMPDWPAVLDAREALAYSRLSETEMRRRIAAGEVVFKPIGHNGKKVCLREQLDEMLKRIWSEGVSAMLDPSEDMDFGDD